MKEIAILGPIKSRGGREIEAGFIADTLLKRYNLKQIDIKSLKLEVNVSNILNIVSQKQEFEIDINGNIYVEQSADFKTPIIFKQDSLDNTSSLLDPNTLLKRAVCKCDVF